MRSAAVDGCWRVSKPPDAARRTDATIRLMPDSQERFASLTLAEFSARLASAEPVPGGGSASAIAGSIAASLLAMVARLSLDRPKYEPYRATNVRALETAEAARVRLLALADDDAVAYAAFSAARKMAHDTPEQEAARTQATEVAAREASEVPLEIVRECGRLLEEIAALAGRSNLNAASDLEVAGRLSAAAAHGAGANVMINLPMVGDERYAGGTKVELNEVLRDIDRTLARIAQRVGQGALRPPESD
jgi:formiminotetrahydrofolate cyclodeaminase